MWCRHTRQSAVSLLLVPSLSDRILCHTHKHIACDAATLETKKSLRIRKGNAPCNQRLHFRNYKHELMYAALLSQKINIDQLWMLLHFSFHNFTLMWCVLWCMCACMYVSGLLTHAVVLGAECGHAPETESRGIEWKNANRKNKMEYEKWNSQHFFSLRHIMMFAYDKCTKCMFVVFSSSIHVGIVYLHWKFNWNW